MKYVTVEEHDNGYGDTFTDEFDNPNEAIEQAEYIWNHLTRNEHTKTLVYVLESVNPDEEADNHLDGNIIHDCNEIHSEI